MAGDKIKILALSLIYTNVHSHGRTSPQYAYMWHQHDPKKFKIIFFSQRIASTLSIAGRQCERGARLRESYPFIINKKKPHCSQAT